MSGPPRIYPGQTGRPSTTEDVPAQQQEVTREHPQSQPQGHSVTLPNAAPLDGNVAAAHGIAARTGQSPTQLAARVSQRLGQLTQVTEAAFSAAMEGPGGPMHLPSGGVQHRHHVADVPAERVRSIVQEFVRKHGEDQLDALIASGRVTEVFKRAYRDAFGVEPVAGTIPQLVRDYDAHLAEYQQRPVLVTAAHSTGDSPGSSMTAFYEGMFEELGRLGLASKTGVLGGLNATENSRAMYEASARHPEMKRMGVMPGVGVLERAAQVNTATIVGNAYGDEVPLYWELSARSFLIGAGLDKQGYAHIEHHVREGGMAIVVEGLSSNEITAPDLPNVVRVTDAQRDPKGAGRRAAQLLAERYAKRAAPAFEKEQEWFGLTEQRDGIIDVERAAAARATKSRVRQLLVRTQERLRSKMPEADLDATLSTLARRIVQDTRSIDPIAESDAWSAQVSQVYRSLGGEVAALEQKGTVNAWLARWFVAQSRRQPPGYFEETRHAMPDIVNRIDVNGDHTFDVERYVDFRLDPLTKAFLGRQDLATDIFLGSAQELDNYYQAKGYEVVHTARRIHGVEFKVLRNQDGVRLVVQGVESEQRLVQVGAFLKKYGVSFRKDMVLGDMNRMRELNRTLLEAEIASLDMPVAGVVLDNQEQALEALAAQFNIDVQLLSDHVRNHQAGGFAFKSVEVTPAGSKEPKVLLFFEPALGTAEADVITATSKFAEVPNYVMAGDGGSFVTKDKPGVLHHIRGIRDLDGQISTWDRLPGVEIISTPGAFSHLHYASTTPMEQSSAWAQEAMRSGAGNTNQEISHAFHAFRAMSQDGKKVRVQPMLAIRDVVGQGAIESGAKSQEVLDSLRVGIGSFLSKLGLSEIISSGEVLSKRSAAPGFAKTTGGVDAARMAIPTPDLSNTGSSQLSGSVEQFRGQKRSLVVAAQDERGLRRLLEHNDASKFWVVTDVRDPHHGRVNQLARSLGYEVVTVGTQEDLLNGRLQSEPNFFVKVSSAHEADQTLREFFRDGSQDLVSKTGRSYRVVDKNEEAAANEISLETLDEKSLRDIKAETQQPLTHLKNAIAWRRERLGLPPARFLSSDAEVDSFMAGRKVHVWAGYSKKSKADIAPEDRLRAERLVEIETLLTDPRRTVQVTGITAYGLERTKQEAASRHGQTEALLGALTESTDVSGLALMQAFDQLTGDWQAAILASSFAVFQGRFEC